MIFDTIYSFYLSLFESADGVSHFWATWGYDFGDGLVFFNDFICVLATVVTIICGIFALFRILGGILKLFKV